jgi:hypothetical protein
MKKLLILGTLVTFVFACLGLSGCSSLNAFPTIPKTDAGVVSVSPDVIINEIKCEIRNFYAKEKFVHVSDDFKLPSDKKGDITLKLQIDLNGDAKASVKTIPIADLLGASFGANLDASNTDTVTAETKFTVRQTISGQGQLDPDACPSGNGSLGIEDALSSFYSDEAKIHNGAPYVGLQTLTFSTAFLINVSAGVNGSLPKIYFVPIGPGLDLSAYRKEAHTLTIAFKGKAAPKSGAQEKQN